jgi:hypothetical protein
VSEWNHSETDNKFFGEDLFWIENFEWDFEGDVSLLSQSKFDPKATT